jgi:hypothetical protein
MRRLVARAGQAVCFASCLLGRSDAAPATRSAPPPPPRGAAVLPLPLERVSEDGAVLAELQSGRPIEWLQPVHEVDMNRDGVEDLFVLAGQKMWLLESGPDGYRPVWSDSVLDCWESIDSAQGHLSIDCLKQPTVVVRFRWQDGRYVGGLPEEDPPRCARARATRDQRALALPASSLRVMRAGPDEEPGMDDVRELTDRVRGDLGVVWIERTTEDIGFVWRRGKVEAPPSMTTGEVFAGDELTVIAETEGWVRSTRGWIRADGVDCP